MINQDFGIFKKLKNKKAFIAKIQNIWRNDLPQEVALNIIRNLIDVSQQLGGDSFMSDGMLLWGREIGWLEDEEFVNAISCSEPLDEELLICWRTNILCWAAKQAERSEGDFFEFGCYKGFSGIVVRKFCEKIFERNNSLKYWWFDIFKNSYTQKGQTLDFTDSESTALKRSQKYDDITLVKGDILKTYIDSTLFKSKKVSFAHFDLNNFELEFEVVKLVMNNVSSGSVLVFDDFAMSPFNIQNREYRKYFNSFSIPILELPTGQGLVIVP